MITSPRTYETSTQIDMAPAKPCTNPALPTRSKKKYVSKFNQAWVTDMTWINCRDRGLSHVFSVRAILISVLPRVEI